MKTIQLFLDQPYNGCTRGKVYFNAESFQDDALFETIHFTHRMDLGMDEEKLFNALSAVSNLFITHYDRYSITFTSQNDNTSSGIQIDFDNLGRGIFLIVNESNFEFLEHFVAPGFKAGGDVPNANPGLPSLIQYVQEHASEFNTIYYPGAGNDFSPFQLFGLHASISTVYMADYGAEGQHVVQRLQSLAREVTVLQPNYFNRYSWRDFMIDDVLGIRQAALPGAIRIPFKLQEKMQNPFSLIYLTTEGVQTIKVLINNDIIPDVLVLQDHGFGSNWTEFYGIHSPLYKALEHNLPPYILKEPECAIWPGYSQVTTPYLPPPHFSQPQAKNHRALFKKDI
jgi:hypothetical protein